MGMKNVTRFLGATLAVSIAVPIGSAEAQELIRNFTPPAWQADDDS